MTPRPKKYLTKAVRMKRRTEAARELGRIGGAARAAKLTPEKRRAIAMKASKAAAKARTRKAKERKAV
jgi:hypothetical protein